MIDARTEELINAALDGELSAMQRAELDESLAKSDEARAYQASLKKLDQHLRAMPQQEIPVTLHGEIAAAVSLPSPASTKVAAPGVAAWPGAIRYGLAASLGLAVAIGFYESQPRMPGPADYEQMIGTIAPDNRGRPDILSEFEFNENGLHSLGSIAGSANGAVLDITVDSGDPIDIRIDLASTGLAFDALAQTLNRLKSFSAAGDEINARSHGQQRFAVLLSQPDGSRPDAGARIRIAYIRNGEVIKQHELAAF